MFLAIFVSEEERTGAQLPVGLVGRCALANHVAVEIEFGIVVPDCKDDAVPAGGGNHAVVAQTGCRLANRSVVNEEATVLAIGKVVLEKRSVATDIGLIIMTFRALKAGDGAY